MSKKYCSACGGSKKMLGMGCLIKPCSTCKGIGMVDELIVPEKSSVEIEDCNLKDESINESKRRGRPRQQ